MLKNTKILFVKNEVIYLSKLASSGTTNSIKMEFVLDNQLYYVFSL